MKSIQSIVEATKESKRIGEMWAKHKNDLDSILRSLGWPKSEFEKGELKCIDEETIIIFDLDEDYHRPYIKKIDCRFYGPSEATVRDLNGLVNLYQKMDKFNWKEI